MGKPDLMVPFPDSREVSIYFIFGGRPERRTLRAPFRAAKKGFFFRGRNVFRLALPPAGSPDYLRARAFIEVFFLAFIVLAAHFL